MIRNIVFDMGMVLMDYHPLAACRAIAPDEEAAQDLNQALFMHPQWIRLDEGTLEPEELGRMAQARLKNGALSPLVPRLLDEMPFNVLTPIPGMDGLVDWVLDAGYRVYLLSNACSSVSRHREFIPRLERFHGAIFSVDEKIIKPDPAIYLLLTRRYGLQPEECFFIDDSVNNVEGAKRMGWEAYCFNGDIPALRRTLEGLERPATDR